MHLLQHAERVRLPVDRGRLQVRRGQHQAPPRPGEQAGVDLGGADLLGPIRSGSDFTSGGLISPVSVSTCSLVVSNTIWNAAASFADASSTRGRVFSFSFAVSSSALASRFVAISTSSRSRASSTPRDVR
ncbi:hypothetical protein [Actinopolymorpha pittospori]|uniref:Uncharacterized protein n=1 Tax=Actinopolymorpha pittospori TaxID=648752 RepID=A0A927MPS5_9ACTN|nr:hypothetical protein [Actinopolymorpha pittospori]MBE1603952.1 hypothetical protein [Actinopolymorpha pittospori]